MGKNKEKKDTVEKEFVSFPDIAADVINVLLYEGKKIADAKKLLARPMGKCYLGRPAIQAVFIGNSMKNVDELKLHVFEMRYLPEETRKLFRSDMRIVVDFLAEGDGYRSDRKIVHKAALIKMIKVLSGEMDTEDVEKWMEDQEIREEAEVTVCELFDQYERKGRAKGIEEGERRGVEKGMKRGIEKGENRFAMLVQILMDGGRNDDLRRAISDRSYREQLYMEVKLS